MRLDARRIIDMEIFDLHLMIQRLETLKSLIPEDLSPIKDENVAILLEGFFKKS